MRVRLINSLLLTIINMKGKSYLNLIFSLQYYEKYNIILLLSRINFLVYELAIIAQYIFTNVKETIK